MNGRARAAVLFIALSWSTVSCSTTSSSDARDQAGPAAPARTLDVCLSGMPARWSSSMEENTVQLPGVVFNPWAVDSAHDVAYGDYQTTARQGVASVDLHTGQLRRLTVMSPQAAGVGWMSFSDPWLAWEQTESQYVLGDWSIQLLNVRTGQQRQLATSHLSDGSVLTGQLSFPVVANGYVAWSQPVSHTSVDLRLYRTDTGESVALDSGRLSSPVLADRQLVWGKLQGHDSQPSLRMADAVTLKRLPVPGAISRPMPIGYLAGSSDYLLWTSGASLMAQRVSTGSITAYRFTSDALKHPFQFLMLAGHFAVWFTGYANSILDLDTGRAVDVPLPSGSAAGGDVIVVARTPAGAKGAIASTAVSWLRVTPQDRLGACRNSL